MTFTAQVIGYPPPTLQWILNGIPVAGANASQLVLTNVSTNNVGTYWLIASNASGVTLSSNAVLVVTNPPTLGVAVNASGLTWVTGGTSPWIVQFSETHDGIAAAASGVITNSQESWVETTVTGPGTLNFWWKVSSELGFDYLEFYINGVLQTGRISGEVNWQQKIFNLPAGTQTLRWRYQKDGSVSNGQDRGWLDQVTFTPQ